MSSAPEDELPDASSPVDAAPSVTGEEARPANAAAADARPTDGSRNVERLAAEIREELAAISSRNLDVERREQRLRQDYHRLAQVARQKATAALAEAERRLAEQNAALEQQAAELAERRARLDEFERELARRTQLARDALNHERAEFKARAGELDGRAAELDVRLAALAVRAHDFDAQAAQIAASQQRLRAQEADLAQRAQALPDLHAREAELLKRQRELDRRWESTREERHRLVREAEELTTRRRALQQEQTGVAARSAELDERQRQLGERTADLEADLRRLAERDAELTRRQAALDDLRRQAEELERQARRHEAEALALRDQSEAYESEARQRALALEVEQERLEGERAALEAAGAEVERLRAERAAEFGQARGALAEQAEKLRAAQGALAVLAAGPSVFTRLWWARSVGLGAVAGLLTAVVWLWGHPQLYRATAELHVFRAARSDTLPNPTSAPGVAVALAEHRLHLLDPRLLDDSAPAAGPGGSAAPELRARWRSACESGRVSVAAGEDRSILSLSVIGENGDAADRLTRAACEIYAQRVNGIPAEAGLPVYYRDFAAWREGLQQELVAARQRWTSDQAALTHLPEAQERERVATDAERFAAELGAVAAKLEEQRAAVAASAAADVPPAHVDPAAVDALLADDAIYQEDRKEFRAAALQFRTELGVVMLLLVDPLKDVQKALADFASSLAQQRELNPPTEVAAVLEACATDVARWQDRLAEFATQWRTWVETVRGLDISADVVELAKQQNTVADAVRRLSEDAAKLVSEVGARIDKLDAAGAGGTRELVVAAALRADHAALKSAVGAFGGPASRLALNENVELETPDRKLRGLKMRLTQRRAAATERLQLEADRQARDSHAARLAEARSQLDQLAQQRDELAVNLLATLRTLRTLDEQVRQHDDLAARVRQDDAEISRLDAWIVELEQKLDDARRHGPQPDRVEFTPPVTQPVALARYRGAATAGGGAFVLTWLICLLMAVRSPWHARHRGAPVLEKLLSSSADPPATGEPPYRH